jgi:hypothetical protein
MESFVQAFVIPQRRPRAKLLLVDGSDKLRAELSQLVQLWLVTSKCCILQGNESFPSQLAKRFGDRRGLFVDPGTSCPRVPSWWRLDLLHRSVSARASAVPVGSGPRAPRRIAWLRRTNPWAE